MCVCLEGKFSEERNKKKWKRKRGVRGSERKPVVWCCAVRCHCEFEDPSHLRLAIRVMEDAEKETRSFRAEGDSLSISTLSISSTSTDLAVKF